MTKNQRNQIQQNNVNQTSKQAKYPQYVYKEKSLSKGQGFQQKQNQLKNSWAQEGLKTEQYIQEQLQEIEDLEEDIKYPKTGQGVMVEGLKMYQKGLKANIPKEPEETWSCTMISLKDQCGSTITKECLTRFMSHIGLSRDNRCIRTHPKQDSTPDYIEQKLIEAEQEFSYPIIFPTTEPCGEFNKLKFMYPMTDNAIHLNKLFKRIGLQKGTIISTKSISIEGFKTYIVSNFSNEESVLIRSYKSSYIYLTPDVGGETGLYEQKVQIQDFKKICGIIGFEYNRLVKQYQFPMYFPPSLLRILAEKCTTMDITFDTVRIASMVRDNFKTWVQDEKQYKMLDEATRTFVDKYNSPEIDIETCFKIQSFLVLAIANQLSLYKKDLCVFKQALDGRYNDKQQSFLSAIYSRLTGKVAEKDIQQRLVTEEYIKPTKPENMDPVILNDVSENLKRSKEQGGGVTKLELVCNSNKTSRVLSIEELKQEVIDVFPTDQPAPAANIIGPLVNYNKKQIGETKTGAAIVNSVINRLCQDKIAPTMEYSEHSKSIKVNKQNLGNLSLENIVNQYKGAKRARYQAALKDIQENREKVFETIEKGQHIYRDGFVKLEYLYKFVGGQQDDFSSRVISGVSSYSITLLQQHFIKNVYDEFKGILYDSCGVIYASSMNSRTIGALMQDEFKLDTGNPYTYAYELDFSGFDSSQGKMHYDLEISWYKTLFQNWQQTNQALNYTLREQELIFKTFIDQKASILCFRGKQYTLKVSQDYGRKSGDPNTSMGNTLINAITFQHVFQNNQKSRAFMLGDDNLFMSNENLDEEWIIEQYKSYGLKVKVIKRKGVYESKFLQSYLVPVEINGNMEHILYRTPGRAICQMQSCPITFDNSLSKIQYIQLQIDGNKTLLKLFPSIKQYYHRVLQHYIQLQKLEGVKELTKIQQQALEKAKDQIRLKEHNEMDCEFDISPATIAVLGNIYGKQENLDKEFENAYQQFEKYNGQVSYRSMYVAAFSAFQHTM